MKVHSPARPWPCGGSPGHWHPCLPQPLCQRSCPRSSRGQAGQIELESRGARAGRPLCVPGPMSAMVGRKAELPGEVLPVATCPVASARRRSCRVGQQWPGQNWQGTGGISWIQLGTHAGNQGGSQPGLWTGPSADEDVDVKPQRAGAAASSSRLGVSPLSPDQTRASWRFQHR